MLSESWFAKIVVLLKDWMNLDLHSLVKNSPKKYLLGSFFHWRWDNVTTQWWWDSVEFSDHTVMVTVWNPVTAQWWRDSGCQWRHNGRLNYFTPDGLKLSENWKTWVPRMTSASSGLKWENFSSSYYILPIFGPTLLPALVSLVHLIGTYQKNIISTYIRMDL